MPQMKPMNWIILGALFLTFFLSSAPNTYFKNFSLSYDNSNSTSTLKKIIKLEW